MKKLMYILVAVLFALVAVSCKKDKDNVISVEGTKWRTTVSGLYISTSEHTLIFSAEDNTVTWTINDKPINGTYAYSENHEEVLLSGLADENYTLSKAYKSKTPDRLVVDVTIGASHTCFVFDKEP